MRARAHPPRRARARRCCRSACRRCRGGRVRSAGPGARGVGVMPSIGQVRCRERAQVPHPERPLYLSPPMTSTAPSNSPASPRRRSPTRGSTGSSPCSGSAPSSARRCSRAARTSTTTSSSSAPRRATCSRARTSTRLYPAEHADFYKYSPTFALLFAPFAFLPLPAGDAAVERAQRGRALRRARDGAPAPRRQRRARDRLPRHARLAPERAEQRARRRR